MNEVTKVVSEMVNWLQDEIDIVDDKLASNKCDGFCGVVVAQERKIAMLETIKKLAEIVGETMFNEYVKDLEC